jgi:hypothetical protein
MFLHLSQFDRDLLERSRSRLAGRPVRAGTVNNYGLDFGDKQQQQQERT